MKRRYVVSWEIDIDADTSVDAALAALRLLRNRESTASVFHVRSELGTDFGEIDLDLLNQYA